MFSSTTFLLLITACLVAGQRPSFAGFRPIGFPDLANKTNDDLGNRFGDDGEPLPLPIEAKGDYELVKRISKMPIDKQPFWYINWKALEEQRRNPQTYDQRPNVFVDSLSNTAANTASNNVNPQNTDLASKFGTVNSNSPSNSGVASSTINSNQPQETQTQQNQGQAQTNNQYGRRRSYRHY